MQTITLEELEQKLNSLVNQINNPKPLLNAIGNKVQNTSELSFERQKSPFGERWKANSPKTMAKKRGSKILIQSGSLSSSIHYQSSKNQVTIGTNLKYAPIHQFGGKAGRNKKVNIPARAFMPINKNKEIPQDLGLELEEMLKEFVLKQWC